MPCASTRPEAGADLPRGSKPDRRAMYGREGRAHERQRKAEQNIAKRSSLPQDMWGLNYAPRMVTHLMSHPLIDPMSLL